MAESYEDDNDRAFRNPLDDLIDFPEGVVAHRQNILPSESNGWGMHLLLSLPRMIVQANLDAQLSMAGFAPEAGVEPGSGLLRFMGANAYVWGMVSDGPGNTTSLLLSFTPGGSGTSEPGETPA